MGITPDAPFTPVDQTLHTPIDVPKLNSYFSISNGSNGNNDNLGPIGNSFYSNAAYSESEDILTDVDESSGPNVSRIYTLSFTPEFDVHLMKIYSQIILLPTITPFLGSVPPLGIVSKVATETLASLTQTINSPESEPSEPLFDAQGIINKDRLRNAAFKHILLLLVRRRLIDLCAAQFNPFCPNYTQQLQEPTSTQILMSLLTIGSSGNGFGGSVYGSMGWNPLSMSNLLLNDQAAPRLRSSSLNLRKQSLSRVNSCSASSWLHIGSIVNGRSGHGQSFNMNPDYNGSTDSILLMHDFVPTSVIPRSSNNGTSNPSGTSFTFGHGLAFPLDVQTPPGLHKAPFSFDTITPPANTRRDLGPLAHKLVIDTERPLLSRSRSSSRGGFRGAHPGPLMLNTDSTSFTNTTINAVQGPVDPDFALNSPFVSATSISDDFQHYSGASNTLGSAASILSEEPGLESAASVGLRSGRLMPESSPTEGQSQAPNHRANLGKEFSLSERKRDSLKLKRGIH